MTTPIQFVGIIGGHSSGIGRITDKISDGQLVDDEATAQLLAWLGSFVAFVRSNDV